MKHSLKYFALIIMLFLSLRLLYIAGNDVFFYFDQARDATIVTDMITNSDIKIQGPSVSGTNDSVYHGVLYYYVIAPLYALFSGNPTYVATGLIFLNLLGLYLTYLTAKTVFKNEKVGLIAAALQSVSVISIHQSSWLSNPNLSAITLPAVYLLTYELFLQEHTKTKQFSYKLFALWGVALAASIQVALQNITLFGAIFIIIFFQFKRKKITLSKDLLQGFAISALTFLIGIFSMILTQFLMWRRGILSTSALNLGDHQVTFIEAIPKIYSAYLNTIEMILTPYSNVVLFTIALLCVFFLVLNSLLLDRRLLWFISFFTAPLWLLTWHYRDPHHSFIGLEILLFVVIANGIYKLWRHKTHSSVRSIAIVFLVIFTATNLFALQKTKSEDIQYFGIQKGAFLQEQLNLIDTTYSNADGLFSFSTLTAPYAINTTWDYLYRWYGQDMYGYVPEYVGIQQAGFVTQNVLPQRSEPLPTHALILEPDTTLPENFETEFLSQSDSNLQINYEVGSLQLYILIQERLHETILEENYYN